MRSFAGYLQVSGAYLGPAVYWYAILDEARERGCPLSVDPRWIRGVVAGMERGLPAEEQAEPLTVPVLRTMGAAETTDIDYYLLLTLPGFQGWSTQQRGVG